MNLTIPIHILKRKDVYSSGKMILAAIEENPVTSMGAIANRLRLGHTTVKQTMRILRERGIISYTRSGIKWKYSIHQPNEQI